MGNQWLLHKMPADAGAGGCHAATTTNHKQSSTTNTDTKSAGKSRKRSSKKPIPSASSPSSPSSAGGGCMSAIFHLFDIQHHRFPFNHQPSFISQSNSIINNIPQQQPPNIILKGLEAPRNSLELEEQEPMVEEVTSSSSSSSKTKQETNFNIPMGGIQIKTKRSRLLMEDVSSSECSSSSPGTKTPNLVARLMGLDLLPENSSPRPSLSSPRPSSSSSHATPALNPLSKLSSSHKNNTRSLPATPRVSTAARPSAEVDYHHRYSLQINKENKRRYDESTTSEYAKQIAKQVRENISRRVCADITNTGKKKEQRRDECLVVLKPKRTSPATSSSGAAVDKFRIVDQENESMPLSCSPRLRLLDIKNNLKKPASNSPKSSPLSSSDKEVVKTPLLPTIKSSPPLIKVEQVQVVKPMKVQKCKKIASEKYDLRLKKMHPQQEEHQFMKKCNKKKSTPLSKQLVNVNTTTKFMSFKKDMASPSSSTTTLLRKQVPLESIPQSSSCQSRSYKTEQTHKLSVQDNVNFNVNGNGISAVTTTSGGSISDHFDYISRILTHTGIEKSTPISITHWYSPSHPLHPSIFNHLEKHFNPTATATAAAAANRKLIFDVTDELLVEILKPYISFKPWVLRRNLNRMYGSELIGKLCEKLGCFPAADCRVLEDIDGLIEGDLRSSTRVVGEIAFEEVAEELVTEIERDVVDTLVSEMAGIICHVGFVGNV